MNKRQKLVQQAFLDNEEEVLKRLEKIYGESLSDIEKKAKKLQDDIEELDKLAKLSISDEEREVLLSRKRAKVYQKKYQEALKKQVSEILDKMHTEEFKTVSEYLDKCYEEGFVGTLYDLQGQGLPLAFPIDQEAMVRAVQLDSKLSKGLYSRLGEDVSRLKRLVASDISRGISTGMTFKQIAGQLKAKTNIGYNNAVRIARTEGHRLQCQAGMDACYKAKEMGADVVKQWDSTLDARTRESHVAVDGQIREIDKPFSNGLMFPGDPSGGAAEVVNCRCALLQRSRKALDEPFTKMNNITKQLETFESQEEYDEFKKAFFSKENKQYMGYVGQMQDKYGTKDFAKVLDKMSDKEYNHYSKLLDNNPIYRKKRTDEGIFTTLNATKIDSVRPKSIVGEMNKSKTGKELLEYLEKENVPVRLYYGAEHPKGVSGQYDPFDDEILVFCDVTKTTKETALAVIHEATHRKLGAKGNFAEEVECYKAEVLHQKGHLTNSDIHDIIKYVKENYPYLR